MERLLSYFEMVRPSAVEGSSSSSTKTDVFEGPITAPSQPAQPSSSSVVVPVRQQTRKRQIYVESTVDDGCYVCTKSLGYNVTEEAHDCVRSLKNWFEQRGINNSFHTWHGKFVYKFICQSLSAALQFA